MNRAQTHMSPAGLVPKEWPLKRLDSLADISYGISDPLDRSLTNGTKILAMPNITRDGRINLEDVPYVSDEKIKNKHLLKYGDLLFNWRNGSKKHLKKTAFFNLDGIYTHVGFLLRIRPNNINSRYLHAYLNFIREKGFFLKAKIQVNNTFNKEELSEVPVVFPSHKEQGAIATIFDLWDHAIGLIEELIAENQVFRNGLIQQLLTGKRRLPGNEGKWKTSKLGFYIREVSQRNRTVGITQVLSVTNEKGFVLPEEYFSRSIASTDLGNYKVVRRNQFAYNPSRINVGSLALLTNFDEGVISPMYVVFETINGLESHYLNYWLSSHEGRQWIRSLAQGTVRNTVSFDALASIELELPPLDEQCTIVKVLRTADHEMELLQARTEALREQKTGLMQQLLTGKKRVTTCAT